jgi:hypothetical protein
MVNSLRWAAGLAADGSTGTSFRLAMFPKVIGSTALNAIKNAAVRLALRAGVHLDCTVAAVEAASCHMPDTLHGIS